MLRLLLVLSLASAGSACGEADRGPAPPGPLEGLLTAVDRAAGTVEAFTMATPQGEVVMRIDPGRDYGFDLNHLNEHLELEQPVRVTFETRGADLYAVQIEDA